jgi:hypothetical protein
MAQEFRTTEIMFSMGHTIEAMLRLHNPLIQKGPELQELVEIFNQLNKNSCPTIGKRYIIPIVEKYQIKQD